MNAYMYIPINTISILKVFKCHQPGGQTLLLEAACSTSTAVEKYSDCTDAY